ncbi:30S ribosomal protein S9 [Patescibacteria group bacterium]
MHVPKVSEKKEKFLYSVGRRKSSVARVRYYPSRQWEFEVNKKSLELYFPSPSLRSIIHGPLQIVDLNKKGQFSVRVIGGGSKSQAESIRLGLARTLLQIDSSHRQILKKAGFLTRDPRVKERKKYGLRGARRAPQWQKR